MKKIEPHDKTRTTASFKVPSKPDVSLIVGKSSFMKRLKAALSLGEELCS